MKNTKIIVIGSDFTFEEKAILKKCEELSIDSEFILFDDLEVQIGAKTKFVKDGKPIFENFSGNERFIIRRSRGNFEKCVVFAEILKQRNFIFTDSFRSISTNLNKEIFLATIESEILPHPPNSFFIEAGKKIHENKKLSFPLLTKPVLGRHGEDIFIHKNLESLQNAINKSSETLIIQEYLEVESEFRAFVIGDKVLGVVKKIPASGTTIANYAAGAEFIQTDLPKELLDESIRLCQSQEIDIGGVDIARDREGNYFLLEINRCPEFQAFAKATKIDVAGEMIKFVLGK